MSVLTDKLTSTISLINLLLQKMRFEKGQIKNEKLKNRESKEMIIDYPTFFDYVKH